jgi:hypothetical protein
VPLQSLCSYLQLLTMPTPSLILVPARFKTGKLYTPLATTSGGVVLGASGDFNVTRATTATRVNASGLIESVASGIPRLDYYTSGGTAGCPALLVEPAATNGAPNVQHLKGPGLAAASGGPTITTGSTDFLAPDGTSGSITKYVGGAASGAVQLAFYTGFSPTISAAGAYTFSLFVKAGATNPLNFCALQFTQYTGGSGTAISYFSLASGTALTSGASIQDYGNGWYRLISPPYTIAAGDLTGNVVFNLAEGNGDVTWPASGALNLTAYAWGAQIEAGSVATSYIPTTTASVTRNADNISLSGAVSGCIGQTQGTIYAEVDVRNLGVETYFIRIDDGSSTNLVALRKLTTNVVRSLITAPTSSGTLNISSATFTAGILKIAFAYKSGEIALCVNGANLTANGTFTFNASFNRISIGSNVTGGTELNDRIRSAALYTTRLTNAELQSLTTL